MKRTLCIALVFALLASTSVLGGWRDVDDSLYTRVYIFDWDTRDDTTVMVADWSHLFYSQLMEPVNPDHVRDFYDRATAKHEQQWPGSRVLYVEVFPFDYEITDDWCWPVGWNDMWNWPADTVFVQDGHSYWSTDCVLGISMWHTPLDPLEGFVRIPDGVDCSREFRVWFDYTSFMFGPLMPVQTASAVP